MNGPSHLPAPTVAAGARIQCSALAHQAFANLQAPLQHSDSAAIRRVAELAASPEKKTANSMPKSEPHSQVRRRRRPADIFAESAPLVPANTQGRESVCDPVIFGPLLISIRPNTDAALDQLGLRDSVLPRLRILVGTVRSSRWEAMFRGPQWDLGYEQAATLSNALFADLQVGVASFNPEVVKLKVGSSFLLPFYANQFIFACSPDHRCLTPSSSFLAF